MIMPRNKNYRGKARRSYSPNVPDNKLVEDRNTRKVSERTLSDADRHIFESKMNSKESAIRFDYTDNVFSYRGDWKSQIKVVKLFFPFIVSKKKCLKFEELVNNAFKTAFNI